jgi:uncharacterized protein with von Willebrand factor type A (vWA) domain
MDKKSPHLIKALPEKSTLSLSSGDRAIGRLTNIELPEQPEGAAATDLAADLFHSLFSYSPTQAPNVPEDRTVNKALLDWMAAAPSWETSRATTVANMPSSLIATPLMWNHLMSDESLQEAMQKQEEANRLNNGADQAESEAQNLDIAAGASGDKELSAVAQQLRNEARALRQQAQAMQQQAIGAAEAATGKPLKQARMAAAVRGAAEAAKEMSQAAAGWGFGPGSPVASDPAQALAFAKANRGKIAKIAMLAGRMKGFALQARRSRVPEGFVLAHVGMTQNITHLFPTELAMLLPSTPDVIRTEKTLQFMQGGLLGYTPDSPQDRRGPFVGAVDVSPSMHGKRDEVGKAVALGIAQTARQEGRDYILFTFASDDKLMRTTVVTNRSDWQAHLEWAGNAQSGGTDFDMALTFAQELLADIDKADCLFISDGECGVSNHVAAAWRSFAGEHGARLFYVPVGNGGYLDIERLADRVLHVNDMDEDTGANLATELGRWL